MNKDINSELKAVPVFITQLQENLEEEKDGAIITLLQQLGTCINNNELTAQEVIIDIKELLTLKKNITLKSTLEEKFPLITSQTSNTSAYVNGIDSFLNETTPKQKFQTNVKVIFSKLVNDNRFYLDGFADQRNIIEFFKNSIEYFNDNKYGQDIDRTVKEKTKSSKELNTINALKETMYKGYLDMAIRVNHMLYETALTASIESQPVTLNKLKDFKLYGKISGKKKYDPDIFGFALDYTLEIGNDKYKNVDIENREELHKAFNNYKKETAEWLLNKAAILHAVLDDEKDNDGNDQNKSNEISNSHNNTNDSFDLMSSNFSNALFKDDTKLLKELQNKNDIQDSKEKPQENPQKEKETKAAILHAVLDDEKDNDGNDQNKSNEISNSHNNTNDSFDLMSSNFSNALFKNDTELLKELQNKNDIQDSKEKPQENPQKEKETNDNSSDNSFDNLSPAITNNALFNDNQKYIDNEVLKQSDNLSKHPPINQDKISLQKKSAAIENKKRNSESNNNGKTTPTINTMLLTNGNKSKPPSNMRRNTITLLFFDFLFVALGGGLFFLPQVINVVGWGVPALYAASAVCAIVVVLLTIVLIVKAIEYFSKDSSTTETQTMLNVKTDSHPVSLQHDKSMTISNIKITSNNENNNPTNTENQADNNKGPSTIVNNQ